MNKVSRAGRSEHLDFCCDTQEPWARGTVDGASSNRPPLPSWFGAGSTEIDPNSRDILGGFPLPQQRERSQLHPRGAAKGDDDSTHLSTAFFIFRM